MIYLFVQFMIQFASNLPMPTYQPTLKSTWKDIMVNLEGWKIRCSHIEVNLEVDYEVDLKGEALRCNRHSNWRENATTAATTATTATTSVANNDKWKSIKSWLNRDIATPKPTPLSLLAPSLLLTSYFIGFKYYSNPNECLTLKWHQNDTKMTLKISEKCGKNEPWNN